MLIFTECNHVKRKKPLVVYDIVAIFSALKLKIQTQSKTIIEYDDIERHVCTKKSTATDQI